MELSVIPVGMLETNCYVVSDENTKLCAVVDPGDDGQMLAEAITRQGLVCKAIFLTHGHHDHVRGVQALREATGAPVYIHKADLQLPETMTAGPLCYTDHYEDGDKLTVGGLTFTVLHTPGHTPGSVCLLCGDTMLAGDTLFLGCCGRTDLFGGSWDEMKVSLGRLHDLEGDYTVYPGHGEQTTLSQERKFNTYMREAAR